MSVYHTYYLGYRDEKGILHALGPWRDGEKMPMHIYSQNAAFGSLLNEEFEEVLAEESSPELIKLFTEEFYNYRHLNLSQLPLSDLRRLARVGYIRYGYVPTKLITKEEKYKINPEDNDDETDELNNSAISPIEYAALNEKSREKYAYYAWEDTDCNAYHAWRIVLIANELACQYYDVIKSMDNVVILMTVD